LKAGVLLIYAGLRVKKIINLFFHFNSAVCQVALCLVTIVAYCDWLLLISKADRSRQFSLIFPRYT